MKHKAQQLWLALVACLLCFPCSASAALVAVDGEGEVTFTPADLVTPVVTAIIAAVGAAVALWVIWTGLKWIFKILGIKR